MRNSLSFRLSSLSLFWIIITLGLTGMLLSYLYRDHIEQHYDAHVRSHLEELVVTSNSDINGHFKLDSHPSDPKFHEPLSGWYWEIRQNGQTVDRSRSLGEETLGVGHDHRGENTTVHEILGPNHQRLRAQMVEFSVPGADNPLIYVATAPVIPIAEDVGAFSWHIRLSFMALATGLLIAVILQVRTALKPLKAIGARIADVRSGKLERLPSNFPRDVQPLVDELNHLLDHNSFLLKRARNQLADLAHSVKNPLTVINNEAREMRPEQRELLMNQTRDISASVDHYLSRARTYGRENALGFRTDVKTVAEDLVFVMNRIYKERNIKIHLEPFSDLCFSGDAQDLEEMLGNLLDNACKFAKSEVWVKSAYSGNRFQLIVEDDGPGIPEKDREKALQRGIRLNEDVTDKASQGIGLAIVLEIAELYGGTILLARSDHGGLRAQLDLPIAHRP